LNADACVEHILDCRVLKATFASNLTQATLAARQRAVQFAVLRALGACGRQLTRLLQAEHGIVYGIGLLWGTLVGLVLPVLATATLPYLAFSDTSTDPATVGIRPCTLTFDPTTIVLSFAALLGAFLVAALVLVRSATRVGVRMVLRIGED
jgi:ABC-type antimicrobial peptide transport system permease subunit